MTGQRVEILYGRDGRRVITSRDGKGKHWVTASTYACGAESSTDETQIDFRGAGVLGNGV